MKAAVNPLENIVKHGLCHTQGMRKPIPLIERQMAKIVGQNVRRLRQERGISVKEMAALLGYSERAINAYEKGERRFTVAQLAQVAHALDVSIDEIVNGRPFDKPAKTQLKRLTISDN